MIEKKLVVAPEQGIHARPAARLVKAAKRHTSKVTLIKDGREANAKSPLKVMTLGAKKGDTVTVRAEGEDEEAAVEALCEVVTSEED